MIFSIMSKIWKGLVILSFIFTLPGCSGSASQSSSVLSAKDYADRIISDLSLTDMEEVKQRVIVGAIFDEKKDVCTDAVMYRSTKEGNNNCVGVFFSDNMDDCLNYLKSYLVSLKKESETSYPTEVFKISNAVVENNDSMAVMIVCENIEDAKREADALTGS